MAPSIHNKGQAAMEFLMTYGWALLVVILAIASLSFYFGFGDNLFVTETCLMGPGFACVDFVADEGSITIAVLNGLGDDLISFYFSHPACDVQSAKLTLKNGQKKLFTVTGCEGIFTEGDFIENAPTFAYKTIDSSIEHTKAFSLSAIVAGGTSQSFGGGSDDGNGFAPGDGDGYIPTGTTVALYKFDDGSGTTLSDSLGSAPGTLQNFDSAQVVYHFDEGSGDTATDSSGNGYNGDLGFLGSICPGGPDLVRCPDWSSGISGGGLYFDGDTDGSNNLDFTDRSDTVNIGQTAGNFVDDFTLTAWTKVLANPSWGGGYIFARKTNNNHYGLLITQTAKLRFVDSLGVSFYDTDPTNYFDGGWHHAGVTIKNGVGQFYVDGKPTDIFTPDMSAPWSGLNTQIGAFNDVGAWTGTFGNLDEVAIYDSPLSAKQMEYLYDQQQAIKEPYWIDGAYGGGLYFDGVDDTVVAGTYPTITDSVTVEAWLYLTSEPVGSFWASKGSLNQFRTVYNSGTGTHTLLAALNIDNAALNVGCSVVPYDTWTHVAVQYDGTTKTLNCFVNMVPSSAPVIITTGDGTLDFASSNFQIGSNGGASGYFHGIIDEVMISDYAKY